MWSSSQMLSKLSFLIANAASITLDQERGFQKRAENIKNPPKKGTPNHRDAHTGIISVHV